MTTAIIVIVTILSIFAYVSLIMYDKCAYKIQREEDVILYRKGKKPDIRGYYK
jgi:hypothetical protein